MAFLLRYIRLIVGALVLVGMAIVAAPAGAQHINPTAESVKEDQLLKQSQAHLRRVHPSGPEGLHARTTPRPRLALLVSRGATLDWRLGDPRHDRCRDRVLFHTRPGADCARQDRDAS